MASTSTKNMTQQQDRGKASGSIRGYIAIEPDKCIGCGTCVSACQEGHARVGLQSEPRIALVKASEISAAVACHQCAQAVCLEACPMRAIVRDEVNGVAYIRVREQYCCGCKLCAIVCPYGALHPGGTSVAGVAGVAQTVPTHAATLSSLLAWDPGVATCAVKCDLCAYDPAGPRCIPACLTKALTLVMVDEGVEADEVAARPKPKPKESSR